MQTTTTNNEQTKTKTQLDSSSTPPPTKEGNIYSLHSSNEKPNDELFHREHIPNTPLWITGNKEQGYCITIQNYKLTEPKLTIPEALKLLETEQWNVLSTLIIALIEITTKASWEDFLKQPPFNNEVK